MSANNKYESSDSVKQMKKYIEETTQAVKELEKKNVELEDAYLDTIHKLVHTAEFRDEDTSDHIIRISRYCVLIAEKLGFSPEEVQNILYAAPMHDIGKIGVPDSILLKPAMLTDEELKIMKTHTTIGAQILANPKGDILHLSQQIALSHHERWDGEGYPKGLSGKDIPIICRIVAVADVFDALTSKRPYKGAYPVRIALDIIKKERGKHFDPKITDIFLENIDEILRIKEDTETSMDISFKDFTWSERDSIDKVSN
jgi:putative two-component system response regulator